MSKLGEILEGFHRPDPAFRSVRATIHHTRTSAPVTATSNKNRPAIGRRNPDAKKQDESEESLLVWAIPPERVRIETERTRDGQTENIIEVMNRDDAWKRFANGTVQRGTRSTGNAPRNNSLPTEYQRHFDPGLIRQFFAALTLEAIGNCHVSGRECLSVRAVEIPGSTLWPHWLAWEADEFEFAADVERAVLLSIVGKVAGEVTERHEVREIAFDEELDESLFTYETRPEDTVEPATAVVEHLSLEEAISRAPFTVLRPTWLPESDRLQCETMYHPARPDDPGEYVSLSYRPGTSFDHLLINQRAKHEKQLLEELQWEVVEVRGRQLNVSDPSPEEGLRVVMFEQDGTYSDIMSDMPLDDLLRVAVSFESTEA